VSAINRLAFNDSKAILLPLIPGTPDNGYVHLSGLMIQLAWLFYK